MSKTGCVSALIMFMAASASAQKPPRAGCDTCSAALRATPPKQPERPRKCTFEETRQGNEDAWADYLAKKKEETTRFTAQVRELQAAARATSLLAGLPAGLPKLPPWEMEMRSLTLSLRPVWVSYARRCRFETGEANRIQHVVKFTGNIAQAAALVVTALGRDASENNGEREIDADSTYYSLLVSPSLDVTLPLSLQREIGLMALAPLNSDGLLAQQYGAWLISAAPISEIVRRGARQTAWQHLANFFAATRTDFRTIDAEVRAVASNQGGHYYWENRLAGSFYRRWSEMGSPHDGDALISRLRFWMVKAAFALNHPAARAWAREVQVEITATSNPALKKDFYLAELRKLVDG